MGAEKGADADILPGDPLARFIDSVAHFSRENPRVKHNAFMPAADNKTSVYRVPSASVQAPNFCCGRQADEARQRAWELLEELEGHEVEAAAAAVAQPESGGFRAANVWR